MAQLHTYLRFNDNKCREAMTFYQKCFGGELEFQTVGESKWAKDMPKEAHGKIMHSALKSGKIELYGSDMMRDKATIGDNVVLSLDCESEKEINDHFKKLSEGGEVFSPIEKAPWGAIFGIATDKYGVEWFFNYQIEKNN